MRKTISKMGTVMESTFEMHERQLLKIRTRFSNMRIKTKIMPRTHCPFDILLGKYPGVRIEVKVSEASRQFKNSGAFWNFNIHRHGFISSAHIDFYVFCIPNFKELGFKAGVCVVVPSAKIGKRKSVAISGRSLINKWSQYINNWSPVTNAVKAVESQATA